MKWTSGVDFIGAPSEIITQATQDQLSYVFSQVNNHVFEFTAEEPGSPNELATGWKHGAYLITNAHAAIGLLSKENLIPTAKGEYVAKKLNGDEEYKLTLRVISREHDLSALVFENELEGQLTVREALPEVGEGCFIVGRSEGTNKKGIMAGKVKKVESSRFYYDIETKPGSSGSPILDIDGKVLGVHQGITPDNGPYNGWGIGITNERTAPLLNEDVEVITQDSGFELPENVGYYALGAAGIVLLSQMGK